MAKSKRKIPASQADKYWIKAASLLKKKGVISKQAKLHGGKYISRSVLKKAQEFHYVLEDRYTTTKVSKTLAKELKEKGFHIAQGNRVVTPNDIRYRKALAAGQYAGVVPVKGGYMDKIILPHTIYDIKQLVEKGKPALEALKLRDEDFIFKYRGYTSYRSFRDTNQLLEYLLHYKGIDRALSDEDADRMQEEFEALEIYRLNRSDVDAVIPTVQERRQIAKSLRSPDRRENKRPTRYEKLDKYTPQWREHLLDKWAEKDRQKRANMTPAKKAEYQAKARERAAKSYQNRKPK